MPDAGNDAVIVGAVRTAIADAYRGSLANVSIHELANTVVSEVLERSGVPVSEVDDLVLGEVLHGGGDIARHVAVELGLTEVPGLAVQRQCATGMSALTVAAAEIIAGMNRVAVAGGVAQMTQSPMSFMGSPSPWRGMQPWLSPSHPDRPDAPNMNMMVTVGENTARSAAVTRKEMDDWSLGSHRKAIAAIDEGRMTPEIVPVKVPGRDGVTLFEVDEHPRRDTSAERLASLRVLSGVADGTITAGNSSPVNDAGAALVVARRDWAEAHGSDVLATVRSWAAVGVDPADTGLAPTKAIPKALERGGHDARRRGPVRDQRSVRLDDRRHDPRARPRSRDRQRQRRRSRAGPSGRVLRCAHRGHARPRAPSSRRGDRGRFALRRRRHGHGHGGGGARRVNPSAAELRQLGASAMGDGGGRTLGPALRPAWPGATLAGPAFTVTAGAGDNLALHVAVAHAPPESILVVDASRAPAYGYWGEVLTTAAMAKGIAGLVIDGGVRDVDAVAARGFPVFSTLVAHRGTSKVGGGGSVGATITIAGGAVRPGDWVVGDTDGVSVVSPAELATVLAVARGRSPGRRIYELRSMPARRPSSCSGSMSMPSRSRAIDR